MTNQERILSNNNLIDQAIAKANSLPEASGGSGNTDVEDGLVTGTVTTYTNDRVTSIDNYAFYYRTNLTSISFPLCTTIGNTAFTKCTNLASISFPLCTTIGNYAFNDCHKLTSALFPLCTTVGSHAFEYCIDLTSISFPLCTIVGDYAFYKCFDLISVSLPMCSYIGTGAFADCTCLTSVSLPTCSYIGDGAFQGCFCLSSLTLGASRVCTLSTSNAFSLTPFAGHSNNFSGTPIIYVPASLLTKYQSATNWAYFSSYFVGDTNLDNSGDSNEEGSENANLINFTVGGIAYQAEEGATWSTWVNSQHNTDGFIISSNYIKHPVLGFVTDSMGMIREKNSNPIVSGCAYQYM